MRMIEYLEKSKKWVLISELRRETKISTTALYEGVIQGFYSYRPFKNKFKPGIGPRAPVLKGFRFKESGKLRFYKALRETTLYKLNKNNIDKNCETQTSKLLEETRKLLEKESEEEEEEDYYEEK